MTIWRVGMLACCIDGSTTWATARGVSGAGPETGDVLRVLSTKSVRDGDGFVSYFKRRLLLLELKCNSFHGYYNSANFRPVVEDKDDAELIARIRACKPIRIPVEV